MHRSFKSINFIYILYFVFVATILAKLWRMSIYVTSILNETPWTWLLENFSLNFV